ncbi:MAG: CvpA family protein [Paludibacteraceae bacterium]|nr:CvpA family protein [Paludibacteraceae bacterium]
MLLLDLILLIILGYFGLFKGIRKGFVMELSGLVGIVVAIYLAKNFSAEIAGWFASTLGVESATSPVWAFVLAMVVGFVGVHFLAILISKLLNVVMLGWLNKLLGALFSTIKILLVLSVMIRAFDMFNAKTELVSEQTLKESKLYGPIKEIADTVLPALHLDEIVNNWKSHNKQDQGEIQPNQEQVPVE